MRPSTSIHQQVNPIQPSNGTKEWFNLQIFEVSSAMALQLAWQSGDSQKGKDFLHTFRTQLYRFVFFLYVNSDVYISNQLSNPIPTHMNIHMLHTYIYIHIHIHIHIQFIDAYRPICMYRFIYQSIYLYIYIHKFMYVGLRSQVTWPSDIFLKRSLTRSSTTFLWADIASLQGHMW